jgi:hypothetical protein
MEQQLQAKKRKLQNNERHWRCHSLSFITQGSLGMIYNAKTLFQRFVYYKCTPDTPAILTYYNYLAFLFINYLQRIKIGIIAIL